MTREQQRQEIQKFVKSAKGKRLYESIEQQTGKKLSRVDFYNRTANQIRLYGDKAYIFHNQDLITVIQIPHNLVKEVVRINRKEG